MKSRAVPALAITAVGTVLVLQFKTGGIGAAGSPHLATAAGAPANAATPGPPDSTTDPNVATPIQPVQSIPPGDQGFGGGDDGGDDGGGDDDGGGPAPRAPLPTVAPNVTAAPTQTPKANTAKAPAGGNRTVVGPTIQTRFGPVQVEVVLKGTTIVDVKALQLPNDRSRSVRISQAVEPILRQEALQAQSANIDLVSGGSWTSDGYAQSLQGALDAARTGT
jgi:uncharacterized protein with FMN-binding domain